MQCVSHAACTLHIYLLRMFFPLNLRALISLKPRTECAPPVGSRTQRQPSAGLVRTSSRSDRVLRLFDSVVAIIIDCHLRELHCLSRKQTLRVLLGHVLEANTARRAVGLVCSGLGSRSTLCALYHSPPTSGATAVVGASGLLATSNDIDKQP